MGGVFIPNDGFLSVEIWEELTNRNNANETYQSNYKEKGFTLCEHWSSTTIVIGGKDCAWNMFFIDGAYAREGKINSYYVRCVRDGQ